MLSSEYNAIQVFITSSGSSTEAVTDYFDGLWGPELKGRVLTNLVTYLSNNTFDIYPNPTIGVAHLSTESNYQVMNSLGQEVVSGKGNSIDLSNQSKGIYILQVDGNHSKSLETDSIS